MRSLVSVRSERCRSRGGDVTYGCRLAPGFEPESEDVIVARGECANRSEFTKRVRFPDEFAEQFTWLTVGAIRRNYLPLRAEPNDVEVDMPPEKFATCVCRIKEAWTHPGKETAHWSVLTYERYLPVNLAQRLDASWASAAPEVEDMCKTAKHYGLELSSGHTVAGYRSGVGRVTTELALRAGRVCAHDISSTHLRFARKRAGSLGLPNIAFHECADEPPSRLQECDLLYPRIVFQHDPPPVIKQLVRLALTSPSGGGFAIFRYRRISLATGECCRRSSVETLPGTTSHRTKAGIQRRSYLLCKTSVKSFTDDSRRPYFFDRLVDSRLTSSLAMSLLTIRTFGVALNLSMMRSGDEDGTQHSDCWKEMANFWRRQLRRRHERRL